MEDIVIEELSRENLEKIAEHFADLVDALVAGNNRLLAQLSKGALTAEQLDALNAWSVEGNARQDQSAAYVGKLLGKLN